MFKQHGTYKNKYAKDIYFYVSSEPDDTGNAVWFTAWYWNHFYKIVQGRPECVRVKKEDFANWSRVE